MPYSITTKDGITINDIPDDMPPDDPTLKQRVATLRAQGGASAADTAVPAAPPGFFAGLQEQITGEQRATQETQSLPEWTTMPELNQLSMTSFKSALGTLLTGPQETVKVLKANFPDLDVRTDEKGNFILKSTVDGQEYAIPPGFSGGDIPRALAGLAAFTPAGRATTIPGAVMAGAATQAGIEAAQQQTGGTFDVGDIGAAGVVGALGPIAAKGFQAVKSGLNRAATPITEAVREAEQRGIVPLTSDVLPPKTFVGKMAQAIAERVPVVGTGPVRAAQQEQRNEAIRTVLRDFGADQTAAATDDVMKALLEKRGADLTKYTRLKGEVIDRLSGAGEVDVNSTISAIDREIAGLESLRTEGVKPVIRVLNDFKNAVTGQSLDNVELLRKQLGEQLKDPSLAAVRSTGEKAVGRIYGALKQDMGDFIKTNGDPRDFTKWSVANKRLAGMVGELQTTGLKTVLAKGEATPEVVRNMLFSQNPSDIRLLYKNLTPAGRANARVAILQEAANKAGGIENVSADQFKQQLKKLTRTTGVFFTGQDAKVVDGLLKALDLTRQAGVAAAKPATGAELTTFAAPSILGYFFGPVEGLVATGGIGALGRAYESKPVRDALLRLSSAPPGQERELARAAVTAIQSKLQFSESK